MDELEKDLEGVNQDSNINENVPKNPIDSTPVETDSIESSEDSTETILPIQEENKIQNPSLQQERKRKNGYKIAFFTLGGVILLGAAGYFGYSYMHRNDNAVLVTECLDSDTKIYETYKDAVVMVKHRYGFFAKIKGKEVQLNVPDATEQTLYGTAFFVDKQGNMITNSHVLQPWNSSEGNEEIEITKSNIRRKIASILTTNVEPDGYETFIAANWGNANADYYGDGDYEDEGDASVADNGADFVSSAEVVADSAIVNQDIAATIPHKEYVSEEDIEVYMKTIEISIALHNSTDEWLPCIVKKISEDSSIDLGVLQLENEETPHTVANIIPLENAFVEDNLLKPGEKAVMLGYPLGEDLAQTSSGVKVQLYNGQISKESDGTKIQYSVTSTNGASGSPIFNNCGELIAVNFSGLDKVQGYNFGIVAKKIKSVYSFSTSPVEVVE